MRRNASNPRMPVEIISVNVSRRNPVPAPEYAPKVSIVRPPVPYTNPSAIPNPSRNLYAQEPTEDAPVNHIAPAYESARHIDNSKSEFAHPREIRPMVEDESERRGRVDRRKKGCCVECFGFAMSIIFLVFTLLYIATSFVCIFDKRSKEVYFKGDPLNAEYKFHGDDILKLKDMNSNLEIRLGDWGYIYRVFRYGIVDSNSDIRKYDVFILILVTGSVTGIMSFILAVLDIEKYNSTKWSYACSVLSAKP
eukprot:TRINITY_DN594_c0_g2_i6.p1 TRINITY_DN594_c0_g2~~TRINITY_DN594_c0_g2_i6.p1  ORF type:complete len:251 (+),score=48.01 TRINITY_DN594_c0_g2_i6:190-942(+)